jgi:hypothetical protein
MSRGFPEGGSIRTVFSECGSCTCWYTGFMCQCRCRIDAEQTLRGKFDALQKKLAKKAVDCMAARVYGSPRGTVVTITEGWPIYA